MQSAFAVTNTDQINLHKMRIPVAVLTQSIETHVEACARRGLLIGTPSHASHDVHRPIGWTVPRWIHLGPDMARQLGVLYRPESLNERDDLEDLRATYWQWHHADAFAPYADALAQRLAPMNLSNAKGVSVEAPAFSKLGLAASLYPDLFRPGQGAVDKDGLVDCAALTARLTPDLPGCFPRPRPRRGAVRSPLLPAQSLPREHAQRLRPGGFHRHRRAPSWSDCATSSGP